MKVVNRISDFYKKEGRVGKIILVTLSVIIFCCGCLFIVVLLSPSNTTQPEPINTTSTPIIATNTNTLIPPTDTITPFPLTLTALIEITATLTRQEATPTETPTTLVLPTATSSQVNNGNTLIIVAVNKSAEYVDIKNTGSDAVNLNGWVLNSERGNQSCGLAGVIQPNEVLRIWAMSGDPGYSCGYSTNIWNNSETDPAVLYNPQGQEVSRY